MSVIPLNCPHDGCRLEKAAYVVRYVNRPAPGVFECFSVCPGCHRAVIAVLTSDTDPDFVNHNGNALRAHLSVEKYIVFPVVSSVDTPEHVPLELHRFYEQAFDSLQRGNWDAAGMMFRRTLEAAVKELHPDGKGNLYTRIENLPDEIGVTNAMKEWAHQVRDIGNEAAHEEPETEADAKVIYNFTNMFLRYAFTMPGMMEARKAEEEG